MENAAVMAEFTTASFQLKSWEASCGTEDKIPRNRELIQITAWILFRLISGGPAGRSENMVNAFYIKGFPCAASGISSFHR